MTSGQPAMDHSGQAVKLEDTFTLLESQDLAVVEEIRHLIREHLSTGKEPWIASSLVDYFYRTHSVRAQEILVEVREPLDKTVIEKIQDGLRGADTRLQAMQLLLYVVNHQPPWTHRLVDRPLFPAFLKCLKTEIDIPILMTGVMTLVILLPVVPVNIGHHLNEVFDIFARLASLIRKKPGSTPDIFMLHLNIGVYVLFLRLYGMFPCTFLNFLATNYTKKENFMVYSDIIAPILEKVKLHPKLVVGSKDAETDKSRWRRVDTHDIVLDCAKMSLDPIEGTREDQQCPIIPRSQPEIPTSMKQASKQQPLQAPEDRDWKEKLERVQEMFPVVEDPASYGFSPSQLLGLATPPASQRATPAFSFHDQSAASLQQSAGGTVSASPQIVTPTPEATLREMPVGEEGLSAKTTPVPPRTGPKTTPVTVNRTQGSSAFTSPFTFRPPVTSQPPSVAPSPMKPNLSSDSLSSQATDTGATRALVFDRIPESKDEGVPRHIEMRLSKDSNTGAGAAGPVPMESLPSIVRDLSAQDSDPLDQEVSRITEAEQAYDAGLGPSGKGEATSASASAPKQLRTPESVVQYMKQVNRIRFNSLTSQNSEPLMLATEKHARPGRARSCPPLLRRPLGTEPQPFPVLRATATNSKLDTVSESAVTLDTKTGGGEGGEGGGGGGFLTSQLSQDGNQACKDAAHSCGGKEGSEADRCGNQTKACTCHPSLGETGEKWLGRLQQMATVFQCMLAPVKVAVCRRCQLPLYDDVKGREKARREREGRGDVAATAELTPTLAFATPPPPPSSSSASSGSASAGESWVSWPVAERALFTLLSPPELLDRHLAQGSDLHTKELSHIPLTSQENISWTHFGGGPPVDEINILRGEILLLQNQVMYERHKRSNHAMRNRRLLRRIAHVSALEEQVQALTDQLECRGKDIQNLQVSLKLLQDHNHRLQQTSDSDEYEKLVDFKTTIQQNRDLQEANIELKNLLLTQKAENDELKKELQEERAKSFELEKDNQMMCLDMATAKKWQEQVEQLQKEMLLMGEAQERLQNLLDHQQRIGQENATLSNNMLVQALRAEIKDLKKDKDEVGLKLDASQCRLVDLEEFAKSKDIVMAEMKNNFEASKAAHAEELKAVEDKYNSMIHINQELISEILRLRADYNCLQQKLASTHLRASRRRDDRGGSPQAGAGGGGGGAVPPPHSSPSPSTSTTTSPSPKPSEERKDNNKSGGRGGGEEEEEEVRDPSSRSPNPRRVSQLSKDSGRGSMLTSGHFPPVPSDLASTTYPSSSSSASSANKPSQPPPPSSKPGWASPPAPKDPSQEKRRAREAQGGDAGSELSDGGAQGLAESRGMLYTDSEDNCSQSSNSIFTADSGVYSKVDHTH
ncbi:hamartin-like [Babylonia areolata]|uniref:hamartin-like n=1 Tax=Babylonia areolata TaxID=304850 RepID=UPI003FD133CB